MLNQLSLKNVGPSGHVEIDFAKRLNIITGDNGLGKSFLLDIAWWALTRRWPVEVNDALTSGHAARPRGPGEASITFEVQGASKPVRYEAHFDRKEQAWVGKAGRPVMPGLVIYAQVDGGYAVWDPARNYWQKKGQVDVQERIPAFVFSPRNVWDGLTYRDRGIVCNGLIADWASWQKEGNGAFESLRAALRELSPDGGDGIEMGALTRIGLDDVRDIPTIRMPYGVEVPILFASAAIRRVAALAYLLVWSQMEHLRACEQTGQDPATRTVLLVDELECHLHPRWQRLIVPALLRSLPTQSIQLIAATHSPLVLASLEPTFDPALDAWFDLDFNPADQTIQFRKRSFEKLGDASKWLMSEAFDLKQAGSLDRERAIEELASLLEQPSPDSAAIRRLGKQLEAVVGDKDPVWARWRRLAEAKGFAG